MNVRTLALPGLADVWRSGTTVALSLGLLVLGLLFHTEVVAAVAVWDSSTAYNHCFLVIPIVLYLIWDRRGVLFEVSANPFPLAALAGIPLALAWLVAERLGVMEGRQLVAMTFVELLFFAVLGPRLWWRLAGPLLYLYFLVPFGAFITPALQDFTTVFVREGLPFLHIPAYIDGYVIEIPEGTFLIAEACAGLRFLIAAIAFGCLYALIMYRSALRRAIFIAVSMVVPIIANGFRALGIVALGHYLGSAEAAETDHVLYGWIFFSIVILMLIVLGLPFREDQQTQPKPTTTPVRRTSQLRPALIGAVALVVLAGIGPTVAAQLDRAAAPDMTAALPALTLAEGCEPQPTPLTAGLDAPGRMIVQRFACGNGLVTLSIEVFSPRSTASRVIAEQRRLTGEQGAEDVEARPLAVANSVSGAWRLIETSHPTHVAATSLWINGKPAQRGLVARARQALNSIMGSRFSPVLVVVAAEGDWQGLGIPGRRQAANTIAVFLHSQSALSDLAVRLAGAGAVRD
jgi:exosortase A